MDRRNAMLTAIGTLAVANHALGAAEDRKPDDRLFKGVASLTVSEFNEKVQTEGDQKHFLARQICFRCTCKPFKGELDKKSITYVEIEGLEPSFRKARLFNLIEDFESELVAGSRLDVHGLILEQNYGVWWIWVYSASPLPAIATK